MAERELLMRMCEPENLALAWRKVRSNVEVSRRASSAGVDEISVAAFEQQWETNLRELRTIMLDGGYRPLPPRRVELSKPGGGSRVIGVLAVRDRVAQRAAQQVLEPLFEPDFLDCSYGFRPGKSVEDALHRVLCYQQAGALWVLDADIASCFDSLDHGLLIHFLEERVADPAMLDLIQCWLESEVLAVDGHVHQGQGRLGQLGDKLLRRLNGAPGLMARPDLSEALEADTGWDPGYERRAAWERVRSDATLMALTAIRPALSRVRPAARWLARRKPWVLGSTGLFGLAALAGLWWLLQQWEPHGQGALQGGALSPLLANVYLHHFDQPLIEKGYGLVRYADDFVICCGSREEAETAAGHAARVLSDLRLRLNLDKTRVVSFDHGFRFLGYQVHGHRTSPPLRR